MNQHLRASIQLYRSQYVLACYTGIGILSLLLLLRIGVIYSYVFEITGVDNNFVFTVLRMLAGYSPYPDPESFPYAGNIYAPLFFDVSFLFGKLLGVNPDVPIEVFRLCRSVSLMADVISVWVLYRILYKNFNVPKDAVLLFTAFFASILCYLAYTFSRVDSLFLTFYTLVFYVLTLPNRKFTLVNIFLLVVLATAATFTKQNGIILPVLIAGWLYFEKEKRKILPFLLAFLIFFFSVYFLYTTIIGYEYLGAYAINGVSNKIDPQWFYTYVFKPLANSLLIVPLFAGLALSFKTLLSGPTNNKITGLAFAFLVQSAFSAGAAFKWGSSVGYFNESFFLGFILIGANITLKEQSLEYWKSSLWLYLPLVVLFFVHVFIQDYLFFVSHQGEKKAYYQQQKEVADYIRPRLNGQHILDLNNPNRDFFKAFLYKEMAVPHFDTIDCCLLPDGNFDYKKLKAEFSNGTIQFIIFPKGNPLNQIWDVPLNRYIKDTSIHQYDIYRFQ